VKKLPLLLPLLLPAFGVQPRALAPLVQQGFDHFYNVEYPEAIAVFRKAVAEQPKDPNRHNHLAQAVMFELMFRSGALESQMVTGANPFLRRPKMEPTAEEDRAFSNSIATSISLSDAKLQANPDDAGALYAKGVALGFRGTYNFLVRRAWLDALKDLTAARKLHNRVVELNPANIDAMMTQGFHDYVVGSLPWSYRMLGFLAGFRGDKEHGLKTVEKVAREGFYNRTDAAILLGVAYRRELRPRDVIPILEDLVKRYPRNYLFLFELSQMYADLGEKQRALEPLERIERLKRSGAAGFRALPQERIDLARGTLLFWYDDLDPAIVALRSATKNAKVLDLNNGASAWLRLGQCLDLKGRRQEALQAYRAAVEFAGEAEAAKEARRYLSRAYRRPDDWAQRQPVQ
jgi:tetratricopeptide (TPR) repeat protein